MAVTVRFALVFTFVLVAGLGSQADAAVSPAFAFALPKAPHRLAADPSLSDAAWQAGKVPGDAAWWNVTARRPADDATTVYLLYDDKYLYAGFISDGIPIGYGDGTPRPVDVSASWGSFGGSWLHFDTAKTSRPIGARYTVGFEYDGSYERSLTTGAADSQFLRRLLLGFNLGPSTNATLALRSINGRGGFATKPGFDVAAALHARTKHGDLHVNFGSPSAAVTLNRLIVKYVLRLGADAGT